jgi:hypothetical protein
MQIDNKSDSLSNNLWAEMTLMTALVVLLFGGHQNTEIRLGLASVVPEAQAIRHQPRRRHR